MSKTMIHVTGHCETRPEAPEEMANKRLRVISRNTRGDCLCLSEDGELLLDVHVEDVMRFTPCETTPVELKRPLIDMLCRTAPEGKADSVT